MVSKVQTALAGTNSNQGQLQAKCKTSLNPKGRTIPRHSVLEVLCSRVLSEIGKKKTKQQTKNLHLSSHAFLKCSHRQTKPMNLEILRARCDLCDLCHSTVTTCVTNRYWLNSAFICAMNSQHLMICTSQRNLSIWRWFPTHLTGEQRFLSFPHAGIPLPESG